MVVIRLARGGFKNRPFYRIVVANSSDKRDGRHIDRVGFYDPLASGKAVPIKIDVPRLEHWISKGAVPSPTVARIVKHFKKALIAEQPVAWCVSSTTKQMVLLGFVGAPWGVKGGFKCKGCVFWVFKDSATVTVVLKKNKDKTPVSPLTYTLIDRLPDAGVLFFKEIKDRESVSLLSGAKIFIHPNDLPPLSTNEYYDYQLVGLSVFSATSIFLGKVTALLHEISHPILEVHSPDESIHLIPFVAHYIQTVSLSESSIYLSSDWVV